MLSERISAGPLHLPEYEVYALEYAERDAMRIALTSYLAATYELEASRSGWIEDHL